MLCKITHSNSDKKNRKKKEKNMHFITVIILSIYYFICDKFLLHIVFMIWHMLSICIVRIELVSFRSQTSDSWLDVTISDSELTKKNENEWVRIVENCSKDKLLLKSEIWLKLSWWLSDLKLICWELICSLSCATDWVTWKSWAWLEKVEHD